MFVDRQDQDSTAEMVGEIQNQTPAYFDRRNVTEGHLRDSTT